MVALALSRSVVVFEVGKRGYTLTQNIFGLVIVFLASGLVSGCNVFEARSGDLECTSTQECTRERACENGYCVLTGVVPDADPNLPDAPNAPDADPNAPDAETVDCWDAAWSGRTRLAFQNSAQGSLANVPILVKLNANNLDYSQTQDSGQDLRFVDGDGSTLPHEIEVWNEAGDSYIWIKVPQIDGGSNSDFVYMLYGNNSAPDAQAKAAVWSSGYQGVWHLNESTGANVDSANAISCAWAGGGSGSQGALGVIGGANSFNNDNADCGVDAVPDTTGSTITAWLNLPLLGDTNQTVVSLDSLTGDESGLGLHIKRTGGGIGTYHDQTYIFGIDASSSVTASSWTYAAIRATQSASGGSIEVSTNGGAWETIASGDTSNLQIAANTPLAFGETPGTGQAAGILGTIDEIRISGVSRSDDWIRTQYLSMTDALIDFTADPQDCP